MYVDGLNLYNGMHDARGRRGLWLDLESMMTALIGSRRELVAVHYFTAVMNGPSGVRQEGYLDALKAHGSVTEPHRGRLQRKSLACRKCDNQWIAHEEKESDVGLGVQMVEDAAKDVYDEAWLLSADSDLIPAVRSVRRIAAAASRDVRVCALFPPHRSSRALGDEVDRKKPIFDKIPEKHQLPDPVIGPDGRVHARPTYWR